MRSVIYKLCILYALLFISYVCMLFIECDANEIKTFIMYLLLLIPSEYYLTSTQQFFSYIMASVCIKMVFTVTVLLLCIH
jgi:hypothetical protein